jgi:hypothetical protein
MKNHSAEILDYSTTNERVSLDEASTMKLKHAMALA